MRIWGEVAKCCIFIFILYISKCLCCDPEWRWTYKTVQCSAGMYFTLFICESTGVNDGWSSLCQHFIADPSAASVHFAPWPCLIWKDTAVIVCTYMEVTFKKVRSQSRCSIFFSPLKKKNSSHLLALNLLVCGVLCWMSILRTSSTTRKQATMDGGVENPAF